MANRHVDIERETLDYRRRQSFFRLCFFLALAGALIATIAILIHSNNREKNAQTLALQQQQSAERANRDMHTASAGIAEQIRDLDRQAFSITDPEAPIIYVWHDGLSTKKSTQIDRNVLDLLNTRRRLISSSLPLLGSSSELTDYICKHPYVVLADTVTTNDPAEWLKTKSAKDPRYSIAELTKGPVHPDLRGLRVGIFLDEQDAHNLADEINRVNNNGTRYKPCDLPRLSQPFIAGVSRFRFVGEYISPPS